MSPPLLRHYLQYSEILSRNLILWAVWVFSSSWLIRLFIHTTRFSPTIEANCSVFWSSERRIQSLIGRNSQIPSTSARPSVGGERRYQTWTRTALGACFNGFERLQDQWKEKKFLRSPVKPAAAVTRKSGFGKGWNLAHSTDPDLHLETLFVTLEGSKSDIKVIIQTILVTYKKRGRRKFEGFSIPTLGTLFFTTIDD